MKRSFLSFALWSLLSAGLLLFASCKKHDDTPTPPAAALMAFNMIPDKQGIAVTLSGNNITNQPLGYTAYTGGYISVFTGERQAIVYDALSGNQISGASATFAENKYYSLFALGYNNYFKTYIIADGIDTLSGSNGKAYIRYINGVADSTSQSNVKISLGSNTIIDENGGIGKVSGFVAVDPGEISFAISSVANPNISASRNFTVEQRKVYTVLLVGVPGATDDNQKVQIRYVENGTLSENAGSQGVGSSQVPIINAP